MDKKGDYGTIHVMEEQMREAGQGVFEAHSGEAGAKRRRKAEPKPAENKMEGAPENKAVISGESFENDKPTRKKLKLRSK